MDSKLKKFWRKCKEFLKKHEGLFEKCKGLLKKCKEFLKKCKKFLKKQGVERIIIMGLFICLVTTLVTVNYRISNLHQNLFELENEKSLLKKELSTFEDAEDYELREMNVTKYAPLSSTAVAGWDFAGDREITASGEQVAPGKTAAAGPNIPFGTKIYVEGKGWYTVNDRGGLIGADDIDLATESKETALEWGIQQRLVIIDLP
ncbi:3D domain-containing protein [Natranaerofaba carboxydovora]|uniref:3D domain-containing protein n=1 Tax=Natranaerofaba carboxydovora TaxID=2742683 RepID=UPI001F140E45|nr:3D domain-containing protein [Natranaerofaba carboxydovora]UMZ73568.1 Cell wall-binding protein YocH [Natranaerofaba carboxydovora]